MMNFAVQITILTTC